MPIELHRIAEIVGCDKQHTEALLVALLHEDASIGEYDAAKKVYTKGRDLATVLSAYLELVEKELGEKLHRDS